MYTFNQSPQTMYCTTQPKSPGASLDLSDLRSRSRPNNEEQLLATFCISLPIPNRRKKGAEDDHLVYRTLNARNAFDQNERHACIHIPRSLPESKSHNIDKKSSNATKRRQHKAKGKEVTKGESTKSPQYTAPPPFSTPKTSSPLPLQDSPS
jgi:hypothetical protein